MRIDLNYSAPSAAPVNIPPPSVNKVEVKTVDASTFHATHSLETALRNQADARTEDVDRAFNLINQVNWPPLVVIRRIASLIAAHLDHQPADHS